MKKLPTIQHLIRRDDLVTKLDLNDFYMHFLIDEYDSGHMQFMWEGRKY